MTLFCSDIDGTLLNADRRLSNRTIAAIRKATSAGHTFILCSSRMPASMALLAQSYGGTDVPMIAYNGAYVLTSNHNVVLDVPIDVVDAKEILGYCAKIGLHASFYVCDNWYTWKSDYWTQREITNTGVHPDARTALEYGGSGEIEVRPPHKVMCMGEAPLVDSMARFLSESSGLITYRSKDTYLEINSASCSKAAGLKTAASALALDLSDCCFFGDNYNDLSAFDVVGTAVAVANARPEVLEAADVVTDRNHDDGVAIFVERWLTQS